MDYLWKGHFAVPRWDTQTRLRFMAQPNTILIENIEIIRREQASASARDKRFVQVVQDLREQQVSVRHIAALTGRSKSSVDRAKRASVSQKKTPLMRLTLPMLYDGFREAGNVLIGYYLAFSRDSASELERDLWAAQIRAFTDKRDSVSPDDRDKMIECIEEWNSERARLSKLRVSGGEM